MSPSYAPSSRRVSGLPGCQGRKIPPCSCTRWSTRASGHPSAPIVRSTRTRASTSSSSRRASPRTRPSEPSSTRRRSAFLWTTPPGSSSITRSRSPPSTSACRASSSIRASTSAWRRSPSSERRPVRSYLARRLLLLVPVLVGVSVVVFLVLHLSPGDPAEIMLGSQATQEDLTRLRRELGLTEPLHVQYLHWVAHVARGDLGRSLWMKRPVLDEVLNRYKATLVLTASGLLLSTLGGIALGVA